MTLVRRRASPKFRSMRLECLLRLMALSREPQVGGQTFAVGEPTLQCRRVTGGIPVRHLGDGWCVVSGLAFQFRLAPSLTGSGDAGHAFRATFGAWDEHLSSVPGPTQQALRALEWIIRHENLVVCGPSGTGKTFLLEALGQAAVETGKHVA
jgi:hypothetical protein